MKKRTVLLVLCLILVPVFAMGAQKKSAKTVTKKFKNVTVGEVFKEVEKQTGYKVQFDSTLIDPQERYSGKFRKEKVTTVIRAVVGNQYNVRGQKGVYVISPKPVKKTVQTSTILGAEEVVSQDTDTQVRKAHEADQRIDSIRQTTTTTVEKRVDTVMVIEKHYETIVLNPQKKSHYNWQKGSFIEPYLGVAYGDNGQTLRGMAGDQEYAIGRSLGLPSLSIGFQYAYFFTENWGFGFGLEAQNYSSLAYLKEYRWADKIDSDGERYDHIALGNNWREHQNTIMAGVPVSLQYKHMFGNDSTGRRLGIFASVGARVSMPVYTNYVVLENSAISHTAHYDRWNLDISEDVHEFGTSDAPYKGDLQLDDNYGKRINATITGDVALLIPVSERTSMSVGVYFTCAANPLKDDPTAAVGLPASGELAWTMPAYQGMANMEMTKNIHPYSVGVKLGWLINAHHEKKVKVKTKRVLVSDTTFQYVEHMDTLRHVEQDTIMRVYQDIEQLHLGSVIYFDLDDATPKLEPADILEKVATILVAHPEIRVEVSGHTCDLGSKAYNKRLSMRRAQAVADELIRLGVSEEQLELQAYSDSKPVYSEKLNRNIERRVEIKPIIEE